MYYISIKKAYTYINVLDVNNIIYLYNLQEKDSYFVPKCLSLGKKVKVANYDILKKKLNFNELFGGRLEKK